MTMTETRPNGRPPMPSAANIPDKPELPPTSVEAIANRADSNIDLIEGIVTENLNALRTQTDEMQKLLRTDADRVRRLQRDLLRSAEVLLSFKQSSTEMLSALRAGRARLVAIEPGEEH